ncbi:MAG: hypothetical protein WCZ00_02735 [Acholeplasmataceae bacterium]
MKKMMMVILVLCFILMGCTRQINEKLINSITENSNFKYALLTEVTEDIKSEFTILDGFGVYMLVDPSINPDEYDVLGFMEDNQTTYYHVTAYPDHIDGGEFITRIDTSDPNIYIYDLSVGDIYSKQELNDYMETIDFYPHEENESIYINEGVKIRVYKTIDTITQLTVEVEVTNKEGIIF